MSAKEYLESVISDADAHFDRVSRINARLFVAAGEPLWLADGYRNPKLLEGANITMAYLQDLLADLGGGNG